MEQDQGCERCRELEDRCRELEDRLAQVEGRAQGAFLPADLVGGRELTRRESEVLDLIAEGRSTQEIAGTLYLSGNSVKTHTRKLFRKIRVTNRTEAAVWALSRGPRRDTGGRGGDPDPTVDGGGPPPSG